MLLVLLLGGNEVCTCIDGLPCLRCPVSMKACFAQLSVGLPTLFASGQRGVYLRSAPPPTGPSSGSRIVSPKRATARCSMVCEAVSSLAPVPGHPAALPAASTTVLCVAVRPMSEGNNPTDAAQPSLSKCAEPPVAGVRRLQGIHAAHKLRAYTYGKHHQYQSAVCADVPEAI